MWTINDFLVYKMISGWSMFEKLACLYCIENNKAFILNSSDKTSSFIFKISTKGSCQVVIDTKKT
jgi:hypothetical protein